MKCSLSGDVCEVPVVCKRTGYVYERRVLEKAVQANGGKCPHSDEPMTLPDDVVRIKTINSLEGIGQGQGQGQGQQQQPCNVPTATDFISSLRHIENEWDARNVELQQLRKTLQQTRQELATALYRCEAANRLLAKRQHDRSNGNSVPVPVGDEEAEQEQEQEQQKRKKAKLAPSNGTEEEGTGTGTGEKKKKKETEEGEESGKNTETQDTTGTKTGGTETETETNVEIEGACPSELIVPIEEMGAQLRDKRKGRSASSDWASASDVTSMQINAKQMLRLGADDASARVTALASGPDGVGFAALSSGAVTVIDTTDMLKENEAVIGSGGIRHIWWDTGLNDRMLVADGGGEVHVVKWKDLQPSSPSLKYTEPLVALQQHPIGTLTFAVQPRQWTWRDTATAKLLATGRRKQTTAEAEYSSGGIHPDGLIYMCGRNDGAVELWDVRKMQPIRNLDVQGPASGPVHALAMSERGYSVMCVRHGGVDVWDLRKPAIVGTVTPDGVSLTHAACDGVGEFGATAGPDVVVLFSARKKGRHLTTVVPGNNRAFAGPLYWGANARDVVVGFETTTQQPAVVKITVPT